MGDKYLVGDVGGTNDDLALVEVVEDKVNILVKKDRSTDEQRNFVEGVTSFLQELRKETGHGPVSKACFAVAGPVENRRVEMPNADFTVDADRIEEDTSLEDVLLINDFDAIGYSVKLLDDEDYKTVQKGESTKKNAPMAVVGAGTGLGKNLLIYDEGNNCYLPHSSEGGHSDLPLRNKEELDMAEYIQEKEDFKHQVSYEHVLSGSGIERIYDFLNQDRPESADLSAAEISNTKDENDCSRRTFAKFMGFYARCCRNYVLDTLPENGLYIAGGIAAQNSEEFNQTFLEEFQNSSPQFRELLSRIPVYVITNYEVSLKGAARAIEVNER